MNIESLIKNINSSYPKETNNLNKLLYSIIEHKTEHNIQEYLFKELNNSRFTLSHNIIYNFIYHKDSYHITIKFNNILLHTIAPYNDIPPIRFLLRIVKRLVCLMNLFSIDKLYTIWLIPIQYNRYFPNGTEVEPIHINGGYTYNNGTTIFVYRYEECAKVLLHELLHHSIFDTYGKWTNQQTNEIQQLCNIHNSMQFNINEAIIEFWAVLFECLFISYEYNIPYKLLIKKEQEWSFNQSYKLLKYQQKYFKEWKEKTNAYCYIIIKTALLLHYEEFIKIKTPYSIDILMNFIKHYITILFKKINVATNKKLKIENSSMRMTLFGDI